MLCPVHHPSSYTVYTTPAVLIDGCGHDRIVPTGLVPRPGTPGVPGTRGI